MEILLWLVPAVMATAAAMLVAGWAGRERTTSARQDEHAQERFARAIQTPHPTSSVSPARPATARPGSARPVAADGADEEHRIVVRPVTTPTAQTAADPAHETVAEPARPAADEQDEDTRRTA